MTRKLIGLVLLNLASPTFAASLDCDALALSADAAPPGYAAQCSPAADATPMYPASTPKVGAPSLNAITVDVRGQGERLANTIYRFQLPDFSTQVPIGLTQASLFALDFSPDGSTLYGVSGAAAATNPSTLFTIDTSTGVATVVAALTGLTAGDSATGLSIDPLSEVAYFSAVGGSPSSSRLYTINLATGALSLVGPLPAPTDPTGTIFIDIAVNCLGEMYGHSISDDALYSIDPATGATTLIGLHGIAANFAQGMDFNNADGTLYAFVYTGSGTNRFGSFNLETGAFTTLVQDNPLGEFEGAFATQCPGSNVFADGFESSL